MRVKDTEWCITKFTLLAQQNCHHILVMCLPLYLIKALLIAMVMAMLGVFYNAC